MNCPSLKKKKKKRDFPGGPVVKNPNANAATWVRSLVWEDSTCHGAREPRAYAWWGGSPDTATRESPEQQQRVNTVRNK